MAPIEDRKRNAADLVLPITVVASIVGGALMIQSRLLGVEHELKEEMSETRIELKSLREAVENKEELSRERLRSFAATLKSLNPSIVVPEVR